MGAGYGVAGSPWDLIFVFILTVFGLILAIVTGVKLAGFQAMMRGFRAMTGGFVHDGPRLRLHLLRNAWQLGDDDVRPSHDVRLPDDARASSRSG